MSQIGSDCRGSAPVSQIGSDSVWELHLANVMVVGSNPELRCIVAGRWDDLTQRRAPRPPEF